MTTTLAAHASLPKQFAEIRKRMPDCRVEVLIPDFQGLDEPLQIVMDAGPTS